MSITYAIMELSDAFGVDEALLVETAQEEPTIKNAIRQFADGSISLDDVAYIFNQVF